MYDQKWSKFPILLWRDVAFSSCVKRLLTPLPLLSPPPFVTWSCLLPLIYNVFVVHLFLTSSPHPFSIYCSFFFRTCRQRQTSYWDSALDTIFQKKEKRKDRDDEDIKRRFAPKKEGSQHRPKQHRQNGERRRKQHHPQRGKRTATFLYFYLTLLWSFAIWLNLIQLHYWIYGQTNLNRMSDNTIQDTTCQEEEKKTATPKTESSYSFRWTQTRKTNLQVKKWKREPSQNKRSKRLRCTTKKRRRRREQHPKWGIEWTAPSKRRTQYVRHHRKMGERNHPKQHFSYILPITLERW